MKTELLALIDDLVKSELYVTEGKFSAAKDAKRIRADIVFLLDKAEREEAAIGAGGVERLRSDAPAAVEPPASQRDELLQVALDFIGTLTGMSPPPIEVAPPEVFAPFYDFVDRVQAITSPHLPAAIEPTSGDWMRADDVGRLTHELDSLLHGHADAANKASLCDLVSIVKCAVEKRGAPLLAAPADALDAVRWRMLPALLEDHQIDSMKLRRDIDAAIAAQAAQKNGGT